MGRIADFVFRLGFGAACFYCGWFCYHEFHRGKFCETYIPVRVPDAHLVLGSDPVTGFGTVFLFDKDGKETARVGMYNQDHPCTIGKGVGSWCQIDGDASVNRSTLSFKRQPAN